jgi:aquaporin Z
MGARLRWTEYAIEAAALALFMISAIAFTGILEHPGSPVRASMPDALVRRLIMGLAMGSTAAAIIYSPWGQRSGAHLNPAVTLTFLRLGRIAPRDARFYVLAQFTGGALGVLAAVAVSGGLASHPDVNYVATVPGPAGLTAAFAGELTISFVMMSMILVVTNRPRIAHYTGAIAGCLIALYITVEAPLSGMSMNPARSLAPAVAAGALDSIWIYCLAPLAGMFAAAELYVRRYGGGAIRCAKLHHPAYGVCHFNCDARAAAVPAERAADVRTHPSPQLHRSTTL